MGRLAFVVLALALCIGDLHAASHQYRRNRMEQGSGLENKELIAMVKKYLHNKVTEKQVEIDRRDLERRGLPKCADCANTVLPDCSPGLSMIPIWKNQTEGSAPYETDCVCLVEYTCCPDNCDQSVKDAIKECKNGFSYKAEYTDCCGCKKYECLPCPTQAPRVCPNCTEWNPDVYQNTRTECPVGDCKRIEKPKPTPPTCNDKCQYVEHGADECGFPNAACKCATPPNCTPDEPEPKECHKIKEVKSKNIYMCDKIDSNQCTPCYSYTYEIIEPTTSNKQCNANCEIPVVTKGVCGSYEQTCKCIEPASCEPEKLEEIPCHHIVRVESTNAFKCKENSTGQCQPCYHWKYVQDELPTTGPAEVCDSRCKIERVVQTGCGVHEKECYCNGITKRQCQPAEPTGLGKCYFAVKVLLNDSFMCDGNKECVQCWRWDLPKIPCAPVPTERNCDPNCKREVRRQNECGCDSFVCVPIVPPNCFPDEPEKNKCYTGPTKMELDPPLFSEKNNVCEKCYNYTMIHKTFPDIKCVENPKCLPKHCWNRWPANGDCGQNIEKCALINEECEKTFDECPCGFEKLTRWSSCKQRRDICIDCSEGVEPPPTENKQCYEEYDGKYMEVCTIKMWRKKKCDFSGLDVSVCPNGGANKITINECGCPVSTCTPCSKMDVQLLVDGSGSIMGDRFKVVGETLAASFLPPLSAAAGNRVALAFFGDNLVSQRTLAQGLDPATMRKYSYPRLGRTLTAKALNELLKQFKKDMRPEATKVLVVITDGNENGGGDVAAAAAKWGEVVHRIYAIGCGGADVTDEGLALISKHYHHNLDSVAGLKKEVTFRLIPQMCPV